MVTMPKLDNSFFQPSMPTKSASSAKATTESLFVEPRAEKPSSASDVSATAAQSKDQFSSTLKAKLTPPIEKKLEDREASVTEESEDSEQISGIDSDSLTQPAPVMTPALMQIKPVGQKMQELPTQAMDHRLAWNSFIHKMKDKLGVSAQEILKAFKSLSKEELAQKPEKNIEKLVAQLGLSDPQAAMARQFFKELILKTDDNTMPSGAKLATDGGPLAAMSNREVREQKTAAAINQMNQQFFLKPQPPLEAQAPVMAQAQSRFNDQIQPQTETPIEETEKPTFSQRDLVSTAAISQDDDALVAAMPSAGVTIPNDRVSTATDESGKPIDLSRFKPVTPKTMPEAKTEGSAVRPAMFEKLPVDEAPQAPAIQTAALSPTQKPFHSAPNFSNQSFTQTPATSTPQAPNQTIPVVPVMPQFGGAPDKNADEKSDDSPDNVMMATDEAAIGNQGAFSVNATDNSQAGQELKKAMPTMAVPELVKQAHVMIKDGGGEMKVVLTPEGLGEVAMKVNVKDGKVNVEMITQSDEAKKVIQDSFHALREGLTQHHLNLESIKVDTTSGLSTQLEQQYKDAQRNQAQQFLEQFHQDNKNWRQSYFDIPGAQLYRSQSQRPSVGPQSLAQSKSANSRRLDLVA